MLSSILTYLVCYVVLVAAILLFVAGASRLTRADEEKYPD